MKKEEADAAAVGVVGASVLAARSGGLRRNQRARSTYEAVGVRVIVAG